MTDNRCMFSTSDRHRKLNQLRWQNMKAHLTNETSYWLKKLLMNLNWANYNVCDLNIDPHVCFFPTLSQDRARPIPLAQPEACPQRSERPVCARSPRKSRNGYPGWTLVQVMTWCRKARSKHLNQCWSESISLYGVIRPELVRESWLSTNVPPKENCCLESLAKCRCFHD